MKKLIVIAVVSMLAAPAALAQSTSASSTATTQGDVDTNVFNPHTAFKDGTIEISSINLKAEAGMVYEQGGEAAMRARLKMGVPVYIFGEKTVKSDQINTIGVFKLKAGGAASIDFTGDTVKRLEVESPSMALVAYNHKLYSGVELDRVARLRHGKVFNDLGWEQQRSIVQEAKPTFTASFNLTEVSYHYLNDKDIQGKQSGAEVTFGNFDLHKAFVVSGVPMDVCLFAKPIGAALGSTKIGEKEDKAPKLVSSFGACLGAQIPKVGEFKGTTEFRLLNKDERLEQESVKMADGSYKITREGINYDDLRMTELKVSAEINKLFGTPIGVGYEYSISSAQTGGADSTSLTDHRHFLKAQMAW